MDAMCEWKQFTIPQVQHINACFLFLQVILLSDIMTPWGKYVNMAYYQGDITNQIDWPTVKYPWQAQPIKTSWAFWNHGLHLLYLRNAKKLLITPLGNWHPSKTLSSQVEKELCTRQGISPIATRWRHHPVPVPRIRTKAIPIRKRFFPSMVSGFTPPWNSQQHDMPIAQHHQVFDQHGQSIGRHPKQKLQDS
jgi:hypothetical protein